MGFKMQWPVDTAGSTVSTIITASGEWTASFHATGIPITFSIPCMHVHNICPGSFVLLKISIYWTNLVTNLHQSIL